MASYTDFQPEPDDNTAAPPVGAPEGSYQGKWVNNTFRYVMAAIRNLGDSTPKIPVDGDPALQVGTMAYQNASGVNITGGTIGSAVAGTVPLRGIIPYGGSISQATALEPNWSLCDGRTVNGYTTPDLRGLFIRAWSDSESPGSTGGSVAAITTSSNGAHDHGGSTGGHALTLGQMPNHYHNEGSNSAGPDDDAGVTQAFQNPTGEGLVRPGSYGNSNDSWIWRTGSVGSNETHSHTIASGGAHTHTVTPTRPPYHALVYIMRTT